jgi:hypothetical protein
LSRIVGSPLTWLLVLMSVQWVLLDSKGKFNPKLVNDTHTYVGVLQQDTFADILSASRTIGYPLFLKVVGPLAPGFGAVPEAHTIVYFATILIFWVGARTYTGSGWIGFAFAAPMIFARLFNIVSRVQADFLSCALAVGTLGFLCWSAALPQRKMIACAGGLFLFSAYQTRPSYLFLIVFVPAVGLLLWICIRGLRWRKLAPWAALICLASGLPFLLFSAVRWATVGHFGLVSYGGVNAIGIAVVLMDSQAVASLPPEVQPLGNRIYRRVRMGKDRVKPYPPNLGGAAYRYNRIVWKISFPMAVEYLADQASAEVPRDSAEPRPPPSLVEVNRVLTDLSVAMFRLRPGRYLEWIATSALRTTRNVVRDPWIRIPGITLLVSIASLALWWVIAAASSSVRGSDTPLIVEHGLRAAMGLALLGVGYYVCHLLLIVAVEIPMHRYTVSTTPFLAGSVIGLLAGLWRAVVTRGSASLKS